ncbi:glycoside hydrolase family 47 protein [Xylariomycetidae sp. FL0641]|nr:glycoside hydrolase family 47 protein [Xylariomycetidae sp. FL0641]
MASISRQARKQRHVFILLAGAALLWWLLSPSFFDRWVSDFSRLQKKMNSDIDPARSYEKSSFDWENVKSQKPRSSPVQLPPSAPGRLPPVQAKVTTNSYRRERERQKRQAAVKAAFRDDWEAYRQYAWMGDALLPISKAPRLQFSGWSATLVDSLDMLWMLGLREEFDEAVDAVARIDFGKSTSGRVNTFETNIRYLGGLMAAYDLSKRPVLRMKAIELGNLLYAAFNTKNNMPVDFIDFDRAKAGEFLIVENSVVSASPGTLSMEMTRLSQITGDPKYYDAMSRVMGVFYEGQNQTAIPGLWPTFVSMERKDVVSGNQFTLGGCADSLYEYLPKMVALLQGGEPKYEIMSIGFLEAAKTLLFRPMIPNDEFILIASSGTVAGDGSVRLDQETEHLSCYLGGTYVLAGKLLKSKDYIDIGAKLAMGCVYGYRSFPTGMMPERINMVACPSWDNCKWDQEHFDEEKVKRPEWKEHLPLGFTTAKDPRYILRPEAIESVLILYRVTGNTMWQDIGWDMFTAIINGTDTGLGTHASVRDVTKAAYPLPQEDYMESFWMAETLKYFYLLFCPPDIISLDEYVFNTEAHPFLRTG